MNFIKHLKKLLRLPMIGPNLLPEPVEEPVMDYDTFLSSAAHENTVIHGDDKFLIQGWVGKDGFIDRIDFITLLDYVFSEYPPTLLSISWCSAIFANENYVSSFEEAYMYGDKYSYRIAKGTDIAYFLWPDNGRPEPQIGRYGSDPHHSIDSTSLLEVAGRFIIYVLEIKTEKAVVESP